MFPKVNLGRRECDMLAIFKEHNLTVQVVIGEITVHIWVDYGMTQPSEIKCPAKAVNRDK